MIPYRLMAGTLVGSSGGQRGVWIKVAVLFTFAAFATISLGVILGPVLAGRSFERLNPDATVNSFLRILGTPHAAALLEAGLRGYRRDQALLFVGPAKESFTVQAYYTMMYLAYPRPLPAVICGEPGKSQTVALEEGMSRSVEIGGVLFFETDPGPWAAGGTRITPKLYISPHTGPASWESFCR